MSPSEGTEHTLKQYGRVEQRMAVPAATSHLTYVTLEEPPQRVFFFFFFEKPDSLSSTVAEGPGLLCVGILAAQLLLSRRYHA